MQAVRCTQPLDLGVNSEFALRFGDEGNHNFADQPKRAFEWQMPGSPLVSDDVTQMVIEHIDDLIIGDFYSFGPSYQARRSAKMVPMNCSRGNVPIKFAVSIWNVN